jgi:heme exporter protein D
MVLPIAHAGHWAFYVLYAVPILIVLGSIAVTMVRQRRERRDSGE